MRKKSNVVNVASVASSLMKACGLGVRFSFDISEDIHVLVTLGAPSSSIELTPSSGKTSSVTQNEKKFITTIQDARITKKSG